jgi:hypothetical protein
MSDAIHMSVTERACQRAKTPAGGGTALGALLLALVVLGSLAACSSQSTQNPGADATARALACSQHNGDATRLADTYFPMFDGSRTTAQRDICAAFVDAGGHAFGFGEIQRMLDIIATIEKHGGLTACVSAVSAPGHSGSAGTPGNTSSPGPERTPGKPTSTPGSSSQSTWTVPSASSSMTMGVLKQIQAALDQGATMQQLVRSCDVPARPASASSASTPTP